MTATEIKAAIQDYYTTNTEKSAMVKRLGVLGNGIKDFFSANHLDIFDCGGGLVAKVTTTEKAEFNEEYAVEMLKQNFPDIAEKVIRTKEYIEDDLLEKEMYNNEELKEAVGKCFSAPKQTVTLRVTQKKGK